MVGGGRPKADYVGFEKDEATSRNRKPILRSPSNAEWKTIIGPMFSIGGLVALPPDQRKWDVPDGTHGENHRNNQISWTAKRTGEKTSDSPKCIELKHRKIIETG